ncbi:hypothetical protein E4U43_007200 [Claviceps pusilla]|uniref:Uncharacterized protein n=1 Tax=Claviceps pusilla TaxID=123648 RepID=A0A9P7NDX1_9HYPO|nr:hypothetical protein E4U43_007200 [Claviceps pusilla]
MNDFATYSNHGPCSDIGLVSRQFYLGRAALDAGPSLEPCHRNVESFSISVLARSEERGRLMDMIGAGLKMAGHFSVIFWAQNPADFCLGRRNFTPVHIDLDCKY